MPDIFGNPTFGELTAGVAPLATVPSAAEAALIRQSFLPFVDTRAANLAAIGQALAQFAGGAPGGVSPAVAATLQQFQDLTLPVIQQQFALQGLAGSPHLAAAAGRTLAGALVPLLQQDLQTRLQALQTLSSQEQGLRGQALGALQAAGQLASGERRLGLDALQALQNQALQARQQLLGGLGAAGQLELQRQQLALQALGGAGQLERGIAQEAIDAQLQEALRRQALAEQASFGVFGGAVLPPTLQAASRTRSSGGK